MVIKLTSEWKSMAIVCPNTQDCPFYEALLKKRGTHLRNVIAYDPGAKQYRCDALFHLGAEELAALGLVGSERNCSHLEIINKLEKIADKVEGLGAKK